MKKTIIIYFILSNFTCFCQNISFSKVISPYGSVESASFVATGIVKQDNNYILSLIGFDTSSVTHVNNLQSLYFAEVDSNGENFQILNKYVEADTNFYVNSGAFIKTHNGGFCYIGDIDSNYNDKGQHFIMFFDSSMNNILTKIIPHDTIWEAIKQVKETHDHSFIIVGVRYVTDLIGNVLIIKIDSFGNQLWKKTIATGDLSGGWQIEETPDKGFLIEGYRSSSVQNYGWPFILKTDSVGNFMWDHFFGGVQINGSASFAITQDSNYIVALGYAVYTDPNGQYSLARLNVIKYTPDGTQIWNKMYDTIRLNYNVNKIQVLPNNDFIVMGSNGKMNELDSYFHFETFLMKFNSNGDSLWRKSYFYSAQNVDENYLYDNILNPDGSITACGFVDGDTIVPFQKIWIMKTDSNGNSPACDYAGVDEIYYTINKGEVRVYPNPATMQTTIAFPQLKEEGDIQLYNMLGQIVYKEKLVKGSSQTKLSIQHLKAGLYKVIVREKGIIKGEVSLVKE